MVHKYQRKTNQQMWDKEQMDAALRAVKEGAKINAAARAHNVPVATLFRRLKKPIKEGAMKGLGRFRPVFTSNQENIEIMFTDKQPIHTAFKIAITFLTLLCHGGQSEI
ncbi:CENP-B N-terminal DNA-binding domain [Popillia japonica]|uniref:CENP-B N-terminal DNA-binding domain n=1 Tax=Popillia japonica TaxID=7064 RepID=A0AAW1N3Z7_POPJA